MNQYSLLRDSFITSEKRTDWEAIKNGSKKPTEYADERIKVEASDIMAKGFKYLNSTIMLIFIGLSIARIIADTFSIPGILSVGFLSGIVLIIVYATDYIVLYRFASKGIVKGNAASGSVIFGPFFPIGIFISVLSFYDGRTHIAWVISLAVLCVLSIFVLYQIANRAYNHAMNEDEG